jgi:outer membrane protein OmpA-like peptidoglycan-associated protein
MTPQALSLVVVLTIATSLPLHTIAATATVTRTNSAGLEFAPKQYPPLKHVKPTSLNNLALSIKVFVAEDVLFAIDSIEINEISVGELNRLIRELSIYPTAIVSCIGHTDSTGTDEHNLALGLQRAQAVKDFMVAAGIAEERISVRSLGETQPTVPNDTPANRAKNRRVSLKFAWEPEPTKQAAR